MTEPVAAPAVGDAAPPDAVVDGINVDAVARAVRACAGVVGLNAGPFGGVASYLPGRRLPGVVVSDDAATVTITARWGATVTGLRAQIVAALRPLVDRRVDIVVADIEDPPGLGTDVHPPATPAPALPAAPATTAAVPAGPILAAHSTDPLTVVGTPGPSPTQGVPS